jgi:pyruvate, water dikinase
VSDRFYWLDQIRVEHEAQVGASAIQLSHLAQHRFPVPSGLIIPVSEFQQYIQHYLSNDSSTHNASTVATPSSRNPQRINSPCIDPELITDVTTGLQTIAADFLLLQAVIEDEDDPHLAQLWTPQICAIAELDTALQRLWTETCCERNRHYWQQSQAAIRTLPLATLVLPLSRTHASGQLWINAESIVIQGFWGLHLNTHPWENPNIVIWSDRASGNCRSQQSHPQTIFYSIPTQLPDRLARSEPLMVADQGWLIPYALENTAPPCLTETQVETLTQMGQELWQIWQTPLHVDWLWDGEQIILQFCQLTQPGTDLSPIDQLTDHKCDANAHFPSAHHSIGSSNASGPSDRKGVSPPVSLLDRPLAVPLAGGIAAAPGEITARAIVLSDSQAILNDLPAHSILVTTHLTPEWLPLIRQAVGIVTEQGGTTSHAAILARELGIPAIVGVPHATQQFHTGDWLHLKLGKIYAATPDTALNDRHVAPDRHRAQPAQVSPRHLPSKTQRLITLSQTEQLDNLHHRSIDGIGLIRAEHLLMPHLENQHPWRWMQNHQAPHLSRLLAGQLQTILRAMSPLPVWYRTADWRSHELNRLAGAPFFTPETNPILGMHGAVSYQQFPEWLDLELSAIAALSSQDLGHLRLLLPFVRTVEEFQFCQKRVQKAGLGHIPLWIMAEVPSVIFSLPDYVAAGVQGITIGMNDLVQLLFAIDRDQPKLSSLFNPNHPAIRQAVQQLIQAANQLNIPCNVCSLTEDADFVAFLVSCGVTGIAANIPDIDRVRNAIAQAEQLQAEPAQAEQPQAGPQ